MSVPAEVALRSAKTGRRERDDVNECGWSA